MALELYQEIIPFTNEKMPHPVSSGNSYSNPVVMPLSFDVTSVYNTVESIVYIRNNDKDKFYKTVAIMLMAPKAEFANNGVATATYTVESVVCSSTNFTVKEQGGASRHVVDVEYSTEMLPTFPISFNQDTWFDGDTNAMLPISGVSGYELSSVNSSILDVKFSYGYDEVSELAWLDKKHCVIIPMIGNSTMPDNSYIPIRIRITLNNESMFTLKKYSINVCYEYEGTIV